MIHHASALDNALLSPAIFLRIAGGPDFREPVKKGLAVVESVCFSFIVSKNSIILRGTIPLTFLVYFSC